MDFIRHIGSDSINILSRAGRIFIFLVKAVFVSLTPPFKVERIFKQIRFVGAQSTLVVLLIGAFTGMVLSLQGFHTLSRVGSEAFLGPMVALSIMKELGPVLTGLMVTARAGSAIAAEIATMKVTSELDALTTMALNPLRFVVVPKMHGAVFTLPFLTILANVLGIFGGMTVAYFYLDISPEAFLNRMGEALYFKDILTGFIKSIVFATIIVLTGSYFGFHAEKGAEGVGKVTTSAVVVAISLVIIADSILGLIFY